LETYHAPLVKPPAAAIAPDGVAPAAGWIKEATSNGRSRPARWNMMMASTEGALTFQKGLGAVHAMAHPLGALEDLPLHHGTLNAVLLPAVLRFNEPAAPEKYERLRRVIGAGPDDDLAGWVADLNSRLGLPRGLAAMGVSPDVLPRVVEDAEQDPATETNAPRRRELTTRSCSALRWVTRASSSVSACRLRSGAGRTRRPGGPSGPRSPDRRLLARPPGRVPARDRSSR
jgi:4-hydroxybutyrate dehydrogenase